MTEIPRRARIDLFTPAEKAIREAIIAVESSLSSLRSEVERLLMFCNEDGSPCDGFRFREEVLRLRAALRGGERKECGVPTVSGTCWMDAGHEGEHDDRPLYPGSGPAREEGETT